MGRRRRGRGRHALLDVPALRRAPSLAWSRDRAALGGSPAEVLVGPPGVVVLRGGRAPLLCDLDTGASVRPVRRDRRAWSEFSQNGALAGARLRVATGRRLLELDLATGEPSFEHTFPRHLEWRHAAPLLGAEPLVCLGSPGTLTAFDAPSCATRWTTKVPCPSARHVHRRSHTEPSSPS